MVRRLVIVALLLVGSARAQELPHFDPHYSTEVCANCRFQIVQSSLTARNTFRLDRFIGNVSVLEQKPDGSFTWTPMYVAPHADNKLVTDMEPNYVLFNSGISVRNTFLMNMRNGVTWALVEDKQAKRLWFAPMR